MKPAGSPDVSVVIPVRNRGGVRLENCLASLAWQDLDQARVEVVVSDLGSSPDYLLPLRRLAASHAVRLVETPASGLWNRARALNVGIQVSRGAVVLCTDVDMVFEPNFLSTVLDRDRRSHGGAIVVCRCWDLPSSVGERRFDVSEYEGLRSRATLRPTGGTGACQAARRDFFEYCRGYDEKLVHWGFEDTDLLWRARRRGLDVQWISDRTSMLHQWHPTTKDDYPILKNLNRLRARLTRHVVVKNPEGWGTR